MGSYYKLENMKYDTVEACHHMFIVIKNDPATGLVQYTYSHVGIGSYITFGN